MASSSPLGIGRVPDGGIVRLNVTSGERAALLDAQNTGQREWMELRASREEQRRLVAATERPLPPAYPASTKPVVLSGQVLAT